MKQKKVFVIVVYIKRQEIKASQNKSEKKEMNKSKPDGQVVVFTDSREQVLSEVVSRDQKELFNILYMLISSMYDYKIGIEMVTEGLSKEFQEKRKETEKSLYNFREEEKEFGEYSIETKGRKRIISVLGWEVSLSNNSIIKSTCPHLTVMMIDCIKDIKGDRYEEVREELLKAIRES